MRLNQVIALVGGRKTAIQQLLTTIHHGWKAERVSGMMRTYQPKHEDGERFPSENKVLQLRVRDELARVEAELADFWNLVGTQEISNTQAKGNIVVNGKTLAAQVPVSTLLFLEKQLTDLATLIGNLPTLPVDRAWQLDADNRCYVSAPEQTVKTKKLQKPLVLYPATPEHPAQTQLITEDEAVGTWTTIHNSGAIPPAEQYEILRRVEKLREAVKMAREEANGAEALGAELGPALLGYIFGG